jgi:hypothetical protein
VARRGQGVPHLVSRFEGDITVRLLREEEPHGYTEGENRAVGEGRPGAVTTALPPGWFQSKGPGECLLEQLDPSFSKMRVAAGFQRQCPSCLVRDSPKSN